MGIGSAHYREHLNAQHVQCRFAGPAIYQDYPASFESQISGAYPPDAEWIHYDSRGKQYYNNQPFLLDFIDRPKNLVDNRREPLPKLAKMFINQMALIKNCHSACILSKGEEFRSLSPLTKQMIFPFKVEMSTLQILSRKIYKFVNYDKCNQYWEQL